MSEFWDCEEPKPFRLMASEYAEWRTFKRWLRRHLSEIEANPDYNYDKEARGKYESNLDICLGDFDKKAVINTDMAIFKWNNKIFMSESEIKDLPDFE